jgi:hypothetical protein
VQEYYIRKMNMEKIMDLFRKHVDTVIILGAFAASVLWMNGKFTDIDKRFSEVEKEMAIIKTVMLLKNILPPELAHAPVDNIG